MKEKYVENLIIGAGPAGATAGFTLLDNGARDTLIVEQQRLIDKDKLCAGILSKDTLNIIKKIFQNPFLPKYTLGEKTLSYHDGEVKAFGSEVAVFKRRELDWWFIQQYEDLGGKIFDNFHFSKINCLEDYILGIDMATAEQVVIRYKHLLVADGALSTIRTRVTGIIPRTILSLQVEYPTKNLYPENVFIFDNKLKGYVWYLNHWSGAVLGAGYLSWSGLSAKSVTEAKLKEAAQKLNIPYQRPRGAFIPFGDDVLLEKGNILFLGDAAGLIDPIYGGGIHNAIESGYRAALSIVKKVSYSELSREVLRIQERKLHRRQAEDFRFL